MGDTVVGRAIELRKGLDLFSRTVEKIYLREVHAAIDLPEPAFGVCGGFSFLELA